MAQTPWSPFHYHVWTSYSIFPSSSSSSSLTWPMTSSSPCTLILHMHDVDHPSSMTFLILHQSARSLRMNAHLVFIAWYWPPCCILHLLIQAKRHNTSDMLFTNTTTQHLRLAVSINKGLKYGHNRKSLIIWSNIHQNYRPYHISTWSLIFVDHCIIRYFCPMAIR